MNARDRAKLRDQLIRHEGIRLSPYLCSLGFWTIAVGYNIDARGLALLSRIVGRDLGDTIGRVRLTEAEAQRQLDHDLDYFIGRIRARFPLFDRLTPVRQAVVVDFVFNLGGAGALGFRSAIRMLEFAVAADEANDEPDAVEAGYTACAYHMLDSLWARQVDDGLGGRFGRADRLATMIRTGRWATK